MRTFTISHMSLSNEEKTQLAIAREAGRTAARLSALAAVIGTIVGAISSSAVIVVQLNAAREEARTAFVREIGTDALTDYVSALIDAEAEQTRVADAISKGTTEEQRTTLLGALDKTSANLKAAKGPVDLITAGDAADLAVDSINLYGANTGYLRGVLENISDEEEHSEEVDALFDEIDANGQVIRSGRITCAMIEGRIRFTEASQEFLRLGEAGVEGQLNDSPTCYDDWMPKIVSVAD